MKYGNLTFGQVEALVNILGGEKAVRAILRGEKAVYRADEGALPLFDRHGRRIAPPGMEEAAGFGGPNSEVCLAQPSDFYAPVPEQRFAKLRALLSREIPMTPAEFRERAGKAVQRIAFGDKKVHDTLGGVCLPIFLPQVVSTDCGTMVDELALLHAVKRVFEERFPSQKFIGDSSKMASLLRVVEGSHHERFFTALNKGPVVALYFPLALQGFLPRAAVEQMASLPEEFLLAGILETAAAIVMYPDVLLRDSHVPTLGCPAVRDGFRDPLGFELFDDNTLIFGQVQIINYGKYSSGLVVLA